MDHAYTQLASRTTQGAAAVRVTVDGVYGNQRLDKREKRVNGQSGAGGVASRVPVTAYSRLLFDFSSLLTVRGACNPHFLSIIPGSGRVVAHPHALGSSF
jgi:hypothetical protein